MTRHEHVVGVVTSDGEFHDNAAVQRMLREGAVWRVAVEGRPRIRSLTCCPAYACLLSPYLTARERGSDRDPLTELPPG